MYTYICKYIYFYSSMDSRKEEKNSNQKKKEKCRLQKLTKIAAYLNERFQFKLNYMDNFVELKTILKFFLEVVQLIPEKYKTHVETSQLITIENKELVSM